MLDIKFNANVDIRKIRYPIMFEGKNICVHCGAEDSLIFVDAFGRETNNEIHPFDHLKCKKCGRNYSIYWQQDPNNSEKVFPTAVDTSLTREFINMIGNKNRSGFDN